MRTLTNPDRHGALAELSKLEGAFVVRGVGNIHSAVIFLVTSDVKAKLHTGLGARYIAAASATATFSATDGNVCAFAGGQMVQ